MEKIKVRGLVCSAGWIFFLWGCAVTIKGFRDAFWGEPEANLYSPSRWEFVSQNQWLTWSGFEIAYGLACAGIAFLLWNYARRLPDFIERQAG
ncbi:MAG: hypothetical protein ACYC5N_08905 [Endomicrobiales bacterium]